MSILDEIKKLSDFTNILGGVHGAYQVVRVSDIEKVLGEMKCEKCKFYATDDDKVCYKHRYGIWEKQDYCSKFEVKDEN